MKKSTNKSQKQQDKQKSKSTGKQRGKSAKTGSSPSKRSKPPKGPTKTQPKVADPRWLVKHYSRLDETGDWGFYGDLPLKEVMSMGNRALLDAMNPYASKYMVDLLIKHLEPAIAQVDLKEATGITILDHPKNRPLAKQNEVIGRKLNKQGRPSTRVSGNALSMLADVKRWFDYEGLDAVLGVDVGVLYNLEMGDGPGQNPYFLSPEGESDDHGANAVSPHIHGMLCGRLSPAAKHRLKRQFAGGIELVTDTKIFRRKLSIGEKLEEQLLYTLKVPHGIYRVRENEPSDKFKLQMKWETKQVKWVAQALLDIYGRVRRDHLVAVTGAGGPIHEALLKAEREWQRNYREALKTVQRRGR